MKRPPATLVLAGIALVAAVSDAVLALQFLEIIPWGEESLDFWGGRWLGALLALTAMAIGLAVCYG